MKNVLNYIVNDGNLRSTADRIVSSIGGECNEPKFVDKFCDMLFRVYVDNRMFDSALELFDYARKSGLEIEERSCFVFLLDLKRSGNVELSLEFLRRMVDSGVEISVYSLTTVVDGLCKKGEAVRAKALMDELVCKGFKPNVFTYNTLEWLY